MDSPVSRATHTLESSPVARQPLGRAIKQAKDDDVPGLAAELAYRAALAVLPFLLMLSALPSVAGSLLGIEDIGDRLIDQADSLLSANSADVMRTLITEVERSKGWPPFVFGLLGTLWAGTLTTGALRKSLNRIYKFDDTTPFLTRKLVDVALTVVSGVMFFFAIVALVIGPAVLGGESAATQLLAVAAALTVVMAAVSLLYWLAPSGENMYRWVTPGALLFGAGWLLFSLGFSAYLSRFGLINHVYGSLGVMIVLLVWLYGSNFFLLLGAELNAALADDRDPNVARGTG